MPRTMSPIPRALRGAPASRPTARLSPALFRGAVLAALFCCAVPAAAASRPRVLVIMLDAVPYEDAASVRAGAHPEEDRFPGFRGPVPLVSGFPSSTSLALTGILEPFGLDKSPGYEPRFFDQERGKVRGGGLISYHTIPFAWRGFFDWEVRGLTRKTILYAWPLRGNRREIGQAIGAFLASNRQYFFAYVNSTDATGHLYGPQRTRAVLAALSRALRDVRERHPDRPFYTMILSDHGMAGGRPLRNAFPGVERALRRDHWRSRREVRDPRDVVLIPFGLLSSFIAHTASGREGAVARTLAGVEGVELCAYPDGPAWTVLRGGGEARIRRCVRGGRVLWSYTPVTGDPLRYAAVLARLGAGSSQDGDGWHPDEAWFEATLDHDFPDALHRIARSFDLVANPASVVCSTAPGWLYGLRRLVFGAAVSRGRLRWTHGALRREDSLGFIMTDHPAWNPPAGARFDEALRFFADLPDFDRGRSRPEPSPEAAAADGAAACAP